MMTWRTRGAVAWRYATRFGAVASVLVAIGVAAPSIAAASGGLVNGGFETTVNALSGWSTFNSGAGTWGPTTSGLATCGRVVNRPTQGTSAALFDMSDVSSGVLVSSPFTVPAGGSLSVDYAYVNEARGWAMNSGSPFSLLQPNQWMRIDVIAANANPQSLSPSDVLATVFDSQAGSPGLYQAWTTGTVDLSAFAGQSVQLRAIDVTTQACNPMWLDNVQMLPAGNLRSNPGFEPGFADWTSLSSGAGTWGPTTSGLATCGSVVNRPTQGTSAALFDMGDVSSGVLVSSPFTVPAGGSLSVDYAYVNEARGWAMNSGSPFSLLQPNQWMRIDVIAANANPQSLSPSDVLATVFDSQAGSPGLYQAWTTGTVDLSAFAGQSVQLRAIDVTTQACNPMWLDNVVLNSQPAPVRPAGLSLSASQGYLTATWLPGPNATTYTCTLLYGFNNLSQFTESTSAHSCSFAYAAGSVPFGIQVVARNASGTSPASVAFYSPPAPSRVVCVRGDHRRVITGVLPSCPPGWRLLHHVGTYP